MKHSDRVGELGKFAIASERGGDGRIDGLLNSEDWNYTVQIYEPHPEILDGA